MFRRLLVERNNLVSPEGQRHFQSVGAGTPQEALRSRDLVKRSIGSKSEWRQPRKIRDWLCQQTTSFAVRETENVQIALKNVTVTFPQPHTRETSGPSAKRQRYDVANIPESNVKLPVWEKSQDIS